MVLKNGKCLKKEQKEQIYLQHTGRAGRRARSQHRTAAAWSSSPAHNLGNIQRQIDAICAHTQQFPGD